MTAYRYTRLAAGTLANGRPLGFDDEVELTDDEAQEDYNKFLIDEGRLLEIDQTPEAESQSEQAPEPPELPSEESEQEEE